MKSYFRLIILVFVAALGSYAVARTYLGKQPPPARVTTQKDAPTDTNIELKPVPSIIASTGTLPALHTPARIPRSTSTATEEVTDSAAVERGTPIVLVPPTATATIQPTQPPFQGESPPQAHVNAGKQESNRLYGGRSSAPKDNSPGIAIPTPEPTETTGTQRVGGQARGYVMLPLMQPNARASIEREIEIMLNSEVNDLYLSVLVDGTFSESFGYLNSVIRRLNTGGRTVTLILYLSSGPTMRRWETTPINTFFSRIDPIQFRALLDRDRSIREELQRLAAESRVIFLVNRASNPANRNLVSVMLEDNLDAHSYTMMRSIVAPVIADSASFMRNPCPGCVRGNDTDSQGDALEMHDPSDLEMLGNGDGYCLDGVSITYPGEGFGPSNITPDQVKTMMDTSLARGLSYFGIWRAARQGGSNQLVHPDQRTYEVATAEQEAAEIELLRFGLQPVEASGQEQDPEGVIDSRIFGFK